MSRKVSECEYLMRHWDYEKNSHLNPDELTTGVHIMASWKCEKCGYLWDQPIVLRAKTKGTCPKCERNIRGPKPKIKISQVPEMMAYWDENNMIKPEETSATKHIYADWECPDCGYKWNADVNTVYYARMPKCPVCNGSKVTDRNNVAARFPEIMYCYDKNKPDNPDLRKLKPNSKVLVGWACPDCKSKWDQAPKDRIQRKKGIYTVSACPFCNGTGIINHYLEREHPDIAEEWDEEFNRSNLKKIHSTSKERYGWICKVGHKYRESPAQRILDKLEGVESCPVCADRTVLPGINSFAVKHTDLLDEWYFKYNNILVDPDKISEKNTDPVWWECKYDPSHIYEMAPCLKVEYKKRGINSCPFCKGRRRKRIHYVVK